MFPLAHTYISNKVTSRKDPLLLFGSVLPDIAATSVDNLGREEIHNSPHKFFEFIVQSRPELKDLALGVLLHCGASKGVDHYSDNREDGFAFVNGEYLNVKVAKLFKIDPGEKSLVLSHNFIEGAVDLLLVKNNPEILELYRDIMHKVPPTKISEALSEYLVYDKGRIEQELEVFKNVLGADNLLSKEAMIEGIVIPVVKKLMHKDINGNEAVNIMTEAINLVGSSYQPFLDDTVREMKVTFAKYL